ncbi:MAG: hypothetical protein JWM93_3979 [Frankiales bacterium]|nr:hypothetical protein [Frankiales bacterium]
MPVWHASLSLRDPAGRQMAAPGRLERVATQLLAPVGGDVEWWIWRPRQRVAHLRVALTPEENDQVPPGCVIGDAGESGPSRRRRR